MILKFQERPCIPCVNRNQECLEGQKKTCKYLQENVPQPSDAPSVAFDGANDIFGDALMLKSEYSDLQDLMEIPNFHSYAESSPKPSFGFIDWRLTEQNLDPSISSIYSSNDIAAFDYDASNHALLTWVQRQCFSNKDMASLLSMLESHHVALLDVIRNLSFEDLLHSEKSFLRQVSEVTFLIKLSGTPAALWRRSGEIVAANRELGQILKLPLETLTGGTLRIYELMAPSSALLYWKTFLSIVGDLSAPQSASFRVEICTQPLLMWLYLKRDSFDLPHLVLGHLLPLFCA